MIQIYHFIMLVFFQDLHSRMTSCRCKASLEKKIQFNFRITTALSWAAWSAFKLRVSKGERSAWLTDRRREKEREVSVRLSHRPKERSARNICLTSLFVKAWLGTCGALIQKRSTTFDERSFRFLGSRRRHVRSIYELEPFACNCAWKL